MTRKLQAYEVIYLTILIWSKDCGCQGKPLLFLMREQLILVNGKAGLFYHENTPLTVLFSDYIGWPLSKKSINQALLSG